MNKLIEDIEYKIKELEIFRKASADFEIKNWLWGQQDQLEWVLERLKDLL